ncbi:MAG: hypothetical protein U9Q03_00395 [Patescibacteria group bacterium]|nr:hypothetical protein [Patescibacteria group bacterium]
MAELPPELLTSVQKTFGYFQQAILEDIARAHEVGYGRDEILPFVIDVDGPHRILIVDRLCPDEDWSRFRDKGLRPVVRGIAPSWLRGMLQSLFPALAQMLERAVETGYYPVIIMRNGHPPVPIAIDAGGVFREEC